MPCAAILPNDRVCGMHLWVRALAPPHRNPAADDQPDARAKHASGESLPILWVEGAAHRLVIGPGA